MYSNCLAGSRSALRYAGCDYGVREGQEEKESETQRRGGRREESATQAAPSLRVRACGDGAATGDALKRAPTFEFEKLVEGEGDVEEFLVALDLEDDGGAGLERGERVAQAVQRGHRLAVEGANDVAGG